MEKIKTIVLGQGIGPVKFGMDRASLVKIIGEPNEKENFTFDDSEAGAAESWHYDEYEMSVVFEESEDWELTSIAVSAAEYELEGKKLMGLKREEVEAKLKSLDLGESEFEDCSSADAPELFLLSFDDAGLNLWFENGELSEIQWCLMPELDEE